MGFEINDAKKILEVFYNSGGCKESHQSHESFHLFPADGWCVEQGFLTLATDIKTKRIYYKLTLKGLWFRFLNKRA